MITFPYAHPISKYSLLFAVCFSASWVKSNPCCTAQQFSWETETADYLSHINLNHILITPLPLWLLWSILHFSLKTQMTVGPHLLVKSISSNRRSLDIKFIILSRNSVRTFIWITWENFLLLRVNCCWKSDVWFPFKAIDSNLHPFANKISTLCLRGVQWPINTCIIQAS